MVKRCVAAGCSNTHADGISLFSFPRDPSLRALWNKQVQRTRADWRDATDYSVLCSEHFTKDCFEQGSVMASQFGIQKRRRLKPDAVLTIFIPPITRDAQTQIAVEKRHIGKYVANYISYIYSYIYIYSWHNYCKYPSIDYMHGLHGLLMVYRNSGWIYSSSCWHTV